MIVLLKSHVRFKNNMVDSTFTRTSQYDVEGVRRQISDLASFPENSQLMAGENGITKVGRLRAMVERAKGFLGLGDRTSQPAVRFELLRLLARGSSLNALNDAANIRSAAQKVGLAPKRVEQGSTSTKSFFQPRLNRFYHLYREPLKPLWPTGPNLNELFETKPQSVAKPTLSLGHQLFNFPLSAISIKTLGVALAAMVTLPSAILLGQNLLSSPTDVPAPNAGEGVAPTTDTSVADVRATGSAFTGSQSMSGLLDLEGAVSARSSQGMKYINISDPKAIEGDVPASDAAAFKPVDDGSFTADEAPVQAMTSSEVEAFALSAGSPEGEGQVEKTVATQSQFASPLNIGVLLNGSVALEPALAAEAPAEGVASAGVCAKAPSPTKNGSSNPAEVWPGDDFYTSGRVVPIVFSSDSELPSASYKHSGVSNEPVFEDASESDENTHISDEVAVNSGSSATTVQPPAVRNSESNTTKGPQDPVPEHTYPTCTECKTPSSITGGNNTEKPKLDANAKSLSLTLPLPNPTSTYHSGSGSAVVMPGTQDLIQGPDLLSKFRPFAVPGALLIAAASVAASVVKWFRGSAQETSTGGDTAETTASHTIPDPTAGERTANDEPSPPPVSTDAASAATPDSASAHATDAPDAAPSAVATDALADAPADAPADAGEPPAPALALVPPSPASFAADAAGGAAPINPSGVGSPLPPIDEGKGGASTPAGAASAAAASAVPTTPVTPAGHVSTATFHTPSAGTRTPIKSPGTFPSLDPNGTPTKIKKKRHHHHRHGHASGTPSATAGAATPEQKTLAAPTPAAARGMLSPAQKPEQKATTPRRQHRHRRNGGGSLSGIAAGLSPSPAGATPAPQHGLFPPSPEGDFGPIVSRGLLESGGSGGENKASPRKSRSHPTGGARPIQTSPHPLSGSGVFAAVEAPIVSEGKASASASRSPVAKGGALGLVTQPIPSQAEALGTTPRKAPGEIFWDRDTFPKDKVIFSSSPDASLGGNSADAKVRAAQKKAARKAYFKARGAWQMHPPKGQQADAIGGVRGPQSQTQRNDRRTSQTAADLRRNSGVAGRRDSQPLSQPK